MGAEECRAQLRNQLLGRVGPGAEAPIKPSIEPGRMTTPVRQLVQLRAVKSLGSFEGSERRHFDYVQRWDKAGFVAPMLDLRIGGGYKLLCQYMPFCLVG